MRRLTTFLFLLALSATPLLARDEASALFNVYCSACHDSNGDRKTVAGEKMAIPDLRSNAVQKLSDDDLFQRIGNGAKHKQYPHTFLKKGMSDTQLKQLIGYIRSMKVKN